MIVGIVLSILGIVFGYYYKGDKFLSPTVLIVIFASIFFLCLLVLLKQMDSKLRSLDRNLIVRQQNRIKEMEKIFVEPTKFEMKFTKSFKKKNRRRSSLVRLLDSIHHPELNTTTEESYWCELTCNIDANSRVYNLKSSFIVKDYDNFKKQFYSLKLVPVYISLKNNNSFIDLELE